jgi:hypothetical protein
MNGQNFEEAYPDFKTGFERPFIEYANACFRNIISWAFYAVN